MEHLNKHHRSEQLAAHFLVPDVHMWLASCRLCLPSSCLLKRKWVYVCVGFLLMTSLHAQPLQIVITNSFLFIHHRWGSAKAQESVGWWEMSASYGYLIKLVGVHTFLKGNGTADWAGNMNILSCKPNFYLFFSLHHVVFLTSLLLNCSTLAFQPGGCDPFWKQFSHILLTATLFFNCMHKF